MRHFVLIRLLCFVAVVLFGTVGCQLTPQCPHTHAYQMPMPQQNSAQYSPTKISLTQLVAPRVANQTSQTPHTSQLSAKSQTSVAATELYQPWNLNKPRSENPIRLVSDEQPITSQQVTPQRTPPPVYPQETLNSPRGDTVIRRSNETQVEDKRGTFNLGSALLKEFRPDNDRKWSQNHAVLQTASFNENIVTVHNVRYSRYKSKEQYTTDYYDAAFNLDDIRYLDLVMVPFRGTPRLAHVESSFGFADGRQIGMSIEARYEAGEKYDPLGAGLRQFELIYIFADERDMIRLGTDVNQNNVYIYRLNFKPEEVRAMFVDALNRANKLAKQPEFYHPLTNSCVTNLVAHINKGRPKSVPTNFRTVVPGLLDSYMYDLKLVQTASPTFKETKESAKVNWLVEKYGDLEYFSAGIRQNMLR